MFVDVWTPMLDENGEPKKDIFLGDRLHMNAEGYKIWRETLLSRSKRA
jgi:lysophospholipase L1-like esterase